MPVRLMDMVFIHGFTQCTLIKKKKQKLFAADGPSMDNSHGDVFVVHVCALSSPIVVTASLL